MGYRAAVSIEDKIICRYKDECRDYNRWLKTNEINKCIRCTHNIYKDPKEEKESYYSEPVAYTIIKVIAFFVIGIAVLGVVLV